MFHSLSRRADAFGARPPRLLVALAWLAALALLAWVGVELFWRWSAPAPVMALGQFNADARETARLVAAQRPFGSRAEATPAGPAVAPTRFRVIGIATGFGRAKGFALIQADGGEARPAVVGDTLANGVVLRAILSDRVEIESAGKRISLPLERGAEGSVPPAPASPQSSAAGAALRRGN